MTIEEYIGKTREVTNFLMNVFDNNMQCVATIISAQADQNTERLIEMLGLVKGRCEDWIAELKAMEE